MLQIVRDTLDVEDLYRNGGEEIQAEEQGRRTHRRHQCLIRSYRSVPPRSRMLYVRPDQYILLRLGEFLLGISHAQDTHGLLDPPLSLSLASSQPVATPFISPIPYTSPRISSSRQFRS